MTRNKDKPSHRMASAWNNLSQHFPYCSGQFCRSRKIKVGWDGGRSHPFFCPFWWRRGFPSPSLTGNTTGKPLTCRTPCQKLPGMQGPHGIKMKLGKALGEIYWGYKAGSLKTGGGWDGAGGRSIINVSLCLTSHPNHCWKQRIGSEGPLFWTSSCS